MPRNPKVEDIDPLKVYFGEPYIIDLENIPGRIVAKSPRIGDILKIGEKRFYQTLNIFICNTTQYRVPLWEMGFDWNTLPDFQLFIMLIREIDPEVSALLFDNLDFSKFDIAIKRMPDSEDETMILWDAEDEIEINADVHNHISQYFRTVFASAPEEKITNSSYLKEWYITKDKRETENRKKKEEKEGIQNNSNLQSIISACVNHPGFKYKLGELKEVGIGEFYDSVKRLQIYEHSTALMKGMYSGFVDGSKINSEDYNFMKEIKIDVNNSVSKKLKENG